MKGLLAFEAPLMFAQASIAGHLTFFQQFKIEREGFMYVCFLLLRCENIVLI